MNNLERQIIAGNIHRIARALGLLNRHVRDIIEFKEEKIRQLDKVVETLLMAQQEIDDLIQKEVEGYGEQ